MCAQGGVGVQARFKEELAAAFTEYFFPELWLGGG